MNEFTVHGALARSSRTVTVLPFRTSMAVAVTGLVGALDAGTVTGRLAVPPVV